MKKIGLMIERHWHYGRRLCEGIASFARENGDLSLEFLNWKDLNDIPTLRRMDGIIARVWNEQVARSLRNSRRPVVDVYGSGVHDDFVLVDQNARLIGQLAARHFIEHRFSRFAFCGYACQRYSVLRRKAFVRALQLNHFSCEVFEDRNFSADKFGRKILGMGDFDFGINPRALARWLKGLEKPIAIFCAHDLVALNLLKVSQQSGIRIPQDVAILGVDDDTLLCDFTKPTISSIDPNPFLIGYTAAQTIERWIGNPKDKPDDIHPAPIGLVERMSTQTFPTSCVWLSDALVHIRRNVARSINASELFSYLNLSHTTVERAFRSELGHSVRQEIANVRIEEAKRLLEKTTLPLADVASRAGFSSKSYFTAVFNAATQRTPLEWRQAKQQRQNER